eukprot:7375817-Prymnesium_polylepis.3
MRAFTTSTESASAASDSAFTPCLDLRLGSASASSSNFTAVKAPARDASINGVMPLATEASTSPTASNAGASAASSPSAAAASSALPLRAAAVASSSNGRPFTAVYERLWEIARLPATTSEPPSSARATAVSGQGCRSA